MHPLPWNKISHWQCTNCGICCRYYDVVLKFPEWLEIVKRFGVEYTSSSLSRLFLRRKANGSCMFLIKTPGKFLCGLQRSKPQACKLWPFKVLGYPKYGNSEDATYFYGRQKVFVYVDPVCTGLELGSPTKNFAHSIIPEFIEIVLGIHQKPIRRPLGQVKNRLIAGTMDFTVV